MAKKLNTDALMIKELLKKGYKQSDIAHLLDIKKEKVSYWARYEIKNSQRKSKMINDIYINTITRWANNKVTSVISSRKIANKINSLFIKKKELDKNGKQLTIHYTTVNNYLKEHFGKPRRIRKVFFLKKTKKKARILQKNFR